MPTIKDVAKLAGVSQATVSNILNGMTGVSLDKVKKVEEAIKTLGYKPDAAARSLKTSKTMNVGIVLPNIVDNSFAQMFTGIERALNERNYTASLYITSEIIENEKRILTMVQGSRMNGLIIATCQPQNTAIFQQLLDSGIKVVFVERKIEEQDCNFVGFDNSTMIYNATLNLIAKGFKRIAILTGPIEYSSEKECIQGYSEALKQSNIEIDKKIIEITNYNKESAYRAAFRLLQLKNIPDVIITSSTQLAYGVFKAISIIEADLPKKPMLVSMAEESWANSNHTGIVKLPRQFMHLGEIAAKILLDNLDDHAFHDTKKIVISNPEVKFENEIINCDVDKDVSFIPNFNFKETLKVLMLESSASYATCSLLADFRKKYGINVVIDTLNYKELYEVIKDEANSSNYDIFEVDIPWLPEFCDKGILMDLSTYIADNPASIEGIIPGILDEYARYDGSYYALPYTYCAQLLFYRKDMFENIKYKRMFYEEYKTELRPPKTWIEFNAVAKFFTKEYNRDSETLYGTTLGGQFSSGAVCEFLPRMWAFGGKTLDERGNVVLNSVETIKALKNYCESFRYASPTSSGHWWGDQVDEFCEGKAAMMMLYSAHATDITDRSKSKVIGNVGFDTIPGGIPVLGGWSLGINTLSKRKDNAFKFISWACCNELAIPFTLLGGFTPCADLYKSTEVLSNYPWHPKSLEDYDLSRKRFISKSENGLIISERRFEEILGEAVYMSITNQIQPEKAIKAAASKLQNLIKKSM